MTHDDKLAPPTPAHKHREPGLFSSTFVFTALFGLTNVLSYVYIVAAGRHLVGASFGVFNALLGVLTLAGVVANSVQTAVTAIAVHNPSRAALRAINRRVAWIAVPAVVVVTLASLPFAHRIGASGMQIVVCGVVAMALQLAYPSIGFMLGLGLVWQQAAIGLAGTVGRLALGVPLMAEWGSVVAGLAGYLVNYVVVLVAAATLAWRHAHPGTVEAAPALRVDRTTMATYIAVFVPFSLDQLLVQLFSPQEGGAYAALSTMSKLVFFGAYPLIATAFPAILRQRDLRGQLRIVGLASVGVATIAGGSAAAMTVVPNEIIGLFFADRFSEAATVLPMLAVGAFAFTLSVLMAHVLIAWGNRWAPVASLAPFAAGIALYASNHGSLDALVRNQFAIYATQLALITVLGAAEVIRRRR